MRDLGSIIHYYRKKNKLTQEDLAEKLYPYGYYLKPNSISSWEVNNSVPNARQLLALCEIFGIYDIYTEFIGSNPINPFRNLNEEGIEKVNDYIRLLERTGDYRSIDAMPKAAKIRDIKVFSLAVSAGPGNFLDSDEYEVYSGTDIPENADFALHIAGDSMEPLFHDGQQIYVQQTDNLSSGEFGIFYLDGNAYIKKLLISKKGTFLVSLNKKYGPIPVQENSEFRIYGRVMTV